ncbi:MAG: hypothetical protein ACOYXC_15240 [Candidatus Rifleibacteriota bacterium]
MIAEDRDGKMLELKPNDAGNDPMINFYDNSIFRIEIIDRFSDGSIDFWRKV